MSCNGLCALQTVWYMSAVLQHKSEQEDNYISQLVCQKSDIGPSLHANICRTWFCQDPFYCQAILKGFQLLIQCTEEEMQLYKLRPAVKTDHLCPPRQSRYVCMRGRKSSTWSQKLQMTLLSEKGVHDIPVSAL